MMDQHGYFLLWTSLRDIYNVRIFIQICSMMQIYEQEMYSAAIIRIHWICKLLWDV